MRNAIVVLTSVRPSVISTRRLCEIGNARSTLVRQSANGHTVTFGTRHPAHASCRVSGCSYTPNTVLRT